MSIHDASLATMGRAEFARLVKRTPADELRQLMHGDQRARVLDEILQDMPNVFRADVAGPIRAVVHWHIGDRPDGEVDRYELVIDNGACTLSPRPERQPNLTLTIAATDFLNVVTGNAHPVLLVMRGRLKTRGDLALTAKFPNLFAVPKP